MFCVLVIRIITRIAIFAFFFSFYGDAFDIEFRWQHANQMIRQHFYQWNELKHFELKAPWSFFECTWCIYKMNAPMWRIKWSCFWIVNLFLWNSLLSISRATNSKFSWCICISSVMVMQTKCLNLYRTHFRMYSITLTTYLSVIMLCTSNS